VLARLRSINVDAQVRQFLSQRELPKLQYHFEQHGRDMGCRTAAEYRARFLQVIDHPPIEFFVVRRSKSRPDLMWRRYDPVTSSVVQYNQTTGLVHSYYLVRDWQAYLRAAEPVRVALVEGTWVIEP
jgi:hypothetical protein